MNRTELAQLQSTQKEMLRAFSQLCDANDIQYFAMYGTLLGAVRHHGTIPWDNDIDLVMVRSEYERFLQISSELPEEYGIRHISYGDAAKTGLTRIVKRGTQIFIPGRETNQNEIHVDIFVFDYSKKLQPPLVKQLSCALSKFFHISKLSPYEKQWLYERFSTQKAKLMVVKAGELFRKCFGSARLECWERALVVSDAPTDAYITTEDVEHAFPTDWFEYAIPMQYEDLMISVPNGYDQVLTTEYGSYMEFPPENERFTADMAKWEIIF